MRNTTLNKANTILIFAVTVTTFLETSYSIASSSTMSAKRPAAKTRISALQEMQAKYKEVKTLTAEFTQKKTTVAMGTGKTSSGHISIKRPNKFHWQTTEPEPSILISNGTKIWYYTPPFREGEKGQVMIRQASDQSQLAIDLISGQLDIKKEFKTKELGPRHYELVPLKPTADIERLELFLEKPTNLVYKLMLFTTTGNQTELMLKNVILGPKLNDSMFNFTPPANTEEIR